ncbi:MAG TPA: hypothetical protein VFI84_00850 [Candidatus Saccharimonadales bacterium]|nr:hypothetical protein [Candidatus Saccharimonadales bacterium]
MNKDKYKNTNYAVQREPSLFYAIRMYGRDSKKVEEVLERDTPEDHLRAIKEAMSGPGFKPCKKNLPNVLLAVTATEVALSYVKEKQLALEMMANAYPVDPVAKVG